MKRLALEKTSDREKCSASGAVRTDRLLRVDAAARPETAVTADERRERHAIGVNEQEQDARGRARRVPAVALGR
jgi:hypothetical protein